MIEGAKTGLIFGAFAGPAGYKLQPLMTGLAAYISAKRQGASDVDAAWEALLFGTFNRFMPHHEKVHRMILQLGGVPKERISYIMDELRKEQLGVAKADPAAKKEAAIAYHRVFEEHAPLKKIVAKALSPETTTKVVSQLEKFFSGLEKKIKLDPLDEVTGILRARADTQSAKSIRALEQKVTKLGPEKAKEAYRKGVLSLTIDSVFEAAEKWKQQIEGLAKPTKFDKKALKLLPKAQARVIVQKIHELLPFERTRADVSLPERAERLAEFVRIGLGKERSTVPKALQALAEKARKVAPEDKDKLLELEKEYENLEKKVISLEEKAVAEAKTDKKKKFIVKNIYNQLSNFIEGRSIEPILKKITPPAKEPPEVEEVPPEAVEVKPSEEKPTELPPEPVREKAKEIIDEVSKEAPKKVEPDVDTILFDAKPKTSKRYVFLDEEGKFVEVPTRHFPIKVPTEPLKIEPEALDLFTYYSGRFKGWPIVLGKTGRILEVAPDRATALQRAAEFFSDPDRATELLAQVAADIREGRLSPRWEPREAAPTERRFSDQRSYGRLRRLLRSGWCRFNRAYLQSCSGGQQIKWAWPYSP